MTTVQAQFLDSAVEGLDVTSSQRTTQRTDKAGAFTCESGTTLDFSYLGVKMGQAPCAALINVMQLRDSQGLELGLRVAQLLQSLDTDRIPENGITLPSVTASAVQTAFSPAAGTHVQFEASAGAFLKSVGTAASMTFTLVTTEMAQKHVNQQLMSLSSGQRQLLCPQAGACPAVITQVWGTSTVPSVTSTTTTTPGTSPSVTSTTTTTPGTSPGGTTTVPTGTATTPAGTTTTPSGTTTVPAGTMTTPTGTTTVPTGTTTTPTGTSTVPAGTTTTPTTTSTTVTSITMPHARAEQVATGVPSDDLPSLMPVMLSHPASMSATGNRISRPDTVALSSRRSALQLERPSRLDQDLLPIS